MRVCRRSVRAHEQLAVLADADCACGDGVQCADGDGRSARRSVFRRGRRGAGEPREPGAYAIFGSRAGLFDAFGADLMERGGFQRVLDAVADPDPRVHLRGGITGGVHTFAAHRDVIRALYSMAALDGDAVGGAIQRTEEGRTKGMARLARRLARNGLLREGLTAREAAHRLWVLTSFDGFDLLYTGRGLAAEEVARILVDQAERGLLADPDAQ